MRAGLVADASANPDDGRSAFAALITARAGPALRAAAPTYLAAVQREFADHLTEREGAVMAKALRRVLDASDREPPPEGSGRPVGN